MSTRKIGLLILILGFGAAVETAYSLRQRLDIGPWGCRVLGGRFYGRSFSFEEQSQKELAAGQRVEITNAFGAVRVRAGAPGEVKVGLRKNVYLESEARAREFASRILLSAENAGPVLRLATNRDELTARRDDVGFETHFDVQVPPGTAVTVRNEHGPVDVADVASADVDGSFDDLRVERVAGAADLKSSHGSVHVASVEGPLALTARHGDVEVRDVAGAARLDVEHGDVSATRVGGLRLRLAHGSLTAQTLRGDLEVHAVHAGVEAADVSGNARVETSFGAVTLTRVGGDARVKAQHGAVEAKDIKGALGAETSFDSVSLENVGGPVEVTVEHGGLRAEGLEKGARVKASGDEVTLDGFRGPVEVEAARGAVRLVPAGPLVEPVTVRSTHGGILLEVPPGSRFTLEARTERGETRIDVPELKITRTEGETVTGTLGGGGSLVKLIADGGDVTVEPRSAAASR